MICPRNIAYKHAVCKYEVGLIIAVTFAFAIVASGWMTCRQPMRFKPRIQLLGLWINTECGKLHVSPGEIAEECGKYDAEIFDTSFQLPDRCPIGANGLAVPLTWFEEDYKPGYTIALFGELSTPKQDFYLSM